MNFLSILFNTKVLLLTSITVSLFFGALLVLITLPQHEQSKGLRVAKQCNAIYFFSAAYVLALTLARLRNWTDPAWGDEDRYLAYMMMILGNIGTSMLIYPIINFIDSRRVDREKGGLYFIFLVLSCVLFEQSFWWDGYRIIQTAILVIGSAIYIMNICLHASFFEKVYRKSLKNLDDFYDEEEEHSLKWMRFCYSIVIINQFLLIIFLILPKGYLKLYLIPFCLFILYFTGNFLSFLGSRKFTLDTFAYRILSRSDVRFPAFSNRKQKSVLDEGQLTNRQLVNLEHRINDWVEDKKYRELDKSKAQIAKELKTSKDLLNLYFSTVKGCDFRIWRTELRVEDAKQMLLEDKDLSINLVGERCGFSDRSNFHRQFTSCTGCTPKQWRDTDGHPENLA